MRHSVVEGNNGPASPGAFVKVVQTGSFTRAADALRTQKARLSRVVSQLERELAVRLLERTTRSLSLTEAGREFFERAHAILARWRMRAQAMQRIRGQPQGTLRLTCGVEFGLVAVSGWIADYLARIPRCRWRPSSATASSTSCTRAMTWQCASASCPIHRWRRAGWAAGLWPVCRGRLPEAPRPAHRAAGAGRACAGGLQRCCTAGAPGAGRAAATGSASSCSRGCASTTAWRRARHCSAAWASACCRGAWPSRRRGRRLQRVCPTGAAPEYRCTRCSPAARYLTPKVRAFIDLAVEAFGSPAAH